MLDIIFTNLLTQGFTFSGFMFCTLTSLLLGILIALLSRYKNAASGGLSLTIGLLPFIVQVIIMLVNGNIGAGVAVAGAFSLVRFRSTPGTAKEILLIFLAMAVGLATGTGYVGIAIALAVVSGIFTFVGLTFMKSEIKERELRITIPENLNYTEVFDEVLEKYTKHSCIISVKTTNLGSLYKIKYRIVLKDAAKEKEMIDELRCRNGNLEILCSRVADNKTEL